MASNSLQSAVPTAPEGGRVADLSRRQLLGGFGLTGAGLAMGMAAMAGFSPRWGDGAPLRHPGVPPAPPVAALPPRTYSSHLHQDWALFRRTYVTPEGRVIDTGNGNASHSEGQGWALMAAQAADDQDTFRQVLDWTAQALQRRSDRLHAWRYKPGQANPVADLNNATDGDLFIAAALARAAVRWQRPDYAERAARIAHDILRLARTAGPRTILLPGADGFERNNNLLVNLSYYAFALFADLAAVAPSPLWNTLRQDGAALMLQARFGQWKLTPDWICVDRRDGAASIAPGWPPRFSYDAIRVPLHVVWGQVHAAPLLEAFCRYWSASPGFPPAWTDLATGEIAPYSAPAGLRAVATLAIQQSTLDATRSLPSVSAANDYYGAGLILLSRIASEDLGQAAV